MEQTGKMTQIEIWEKSVQTRQIRPIRVTILNKGKKKRNR